MTSTSTLPFVTEMLGLGRVAIQEGHDPEQTVRFTAYDLLISTNRPTNNLGYERLKAALTRLSGTRIQTNIKTGDVEIMKDFGLIDSWGVVKEDPDGRMIAVEVKLSDWFYHAVISNELLTISREYFRLRRPLDRRIYELVRKHCGDQPSWKVGLGILQKKVGGNAPLKKFRLNVRQIVETNHLPDYSIALSDDDIVTFTNRRRAVSSGRQTSLPLLLTETYEKAKRAAPGLDVYYLERQWRGWSAGKAPPRNPDAAFVGFCKKISPGKDNLLPQVFCLNKSGWEGCPPCSIINRALKEPRGAESFKSF